MKWHSQQSCARLFKLLRNNLSKIASENLTLEIWFVFFCTSVIDSILLDRISSEEKSKFIRFRINGPNLRPPRYI
jgi:hypothetical protein